MCVCMQAFLFVILFFRGHTYEFLSIFFHAPANCKKLFWVLELFASPLLSSMIGMNTERWKSSDDKKKFENENFIQYLSRAFIFQVFVDAYSKRCLWCFLGLFYFRLERCCLHLMYNSMKILIKLFTGSKCVTIIP